MTVEAVDVQTKTNRCCAATCFSLKAFEKKLHRFHQPVLPFNRQFFFPLVGEAGMLRLYERHIMIHISRSSTKPSNKQCSAVRSHVRAPQTLLELDYPSGYCGQELGDDYIFISDSGGKAMMMKALAPFDYLQKFAEEVALEHSDRAQQYLKALRAGQRFAWTFADDEVALLSLVVLLPIGPRTVMCISTKNGLVDAGGNLDYLAEFTTRGAIEMQVGTSNFCK